MTILMANVWTQLVEPMVSNLTPDLANAVLGIRLDDRIQVRVSELAGRNTEGQLSPAEREEYEAWVTAAGFLSLLKAEARAKLAERNPA